MISKSLIGREIEKRIHSVRNQRVMIDSDVAVIFGINTGRLNEQVKRNIKRFPSEVRFQLTMEEYETLNTILARPIFSHGGRRSLPYAFTEIGIVILCGIFNNDRAIQTSLSLARRFVTLQHLVQDLEKPAHTPPTPTIKDSEPYQTIAAIQKAVAQYYCIKPQDLLSNTRVKGIVVPRQIAIYLVRKHTNLGFKEIGTHFGEKDHSTILHACEKIQREIEKHETVCRVVEGSLFSMRLSPNAKKVL